MKDYMTQRRVTKQFCDYKPQMGRTDIIIKKGRRVVIGNSLATVLSEHDGITLVIHDTGGCSFVFNSVIRSRKEPNL